MSLEYLIPIVVAAAANGFVCGSACGSCGNPMTNVFLASYLFTHSGQMKKSVSSFISFYIGKIIAVVVLCVVAAWFGSLIVDESGRLFGLNMQFIVQLLMLVFSLFLIGRWFFYKEKTEHCDNSQKKNLPLFVCGLISGAAPCAPLIMAVGYASTLSVVNAAIIGLVFSVASSLLPLIILVVLTGLLSSVMFREIPNKIKYFLLGAYVLFAVISGLSLLTM